MQQTDAAAASEREQRRHQAVDVEERHDVEAAVVGRELERRARCCAREATRLACASGTSFGREVVPEVWRRSATSSSLAGVAVARGRGWPSRRRVRSPGSPARTRSSTPAGISGAGGAGGDDQGLRTEVFEVEEDLGVRVGGVEGGGAAVAGHTEEGERHQWPVGEDDADAVGGGNAGAGELSAEAVDLAADGVVAQGEAAGRGDGRRAGVAGGEEVKKGRHGP